MKAHLIAEYSPARSSDARSFGVFMPPVVRAPTRRRDRSAGQAGLGPWTAERTPVRNRVPGSFRSARGVATGPERARSRRWCRDPGGASSVRTTHRIGRRVPRGSRHGSLSISAPHQPYESISAPHQPYEYCRTIIVCVRRTEWLHLGEKRDRQRPSRTASQRTSSMENPSWVN